LQRQCWYGWRCPKRDRGDTHPNDQRVIARTAASGAERKPMLKFAASGLAPEAAIDGALCCPVLPNSKS
jgi:hypothetical protein